MSLKRAYIWQMLKPRNFSRVTPMAYIFLAGMFLLVLGIIFWVGLLASLGLFIVALFALYIYFEIFR
jgi:protein-S-isoprenylcysteine O-methyltransferase Ste14